jgi:hypothetical protein
MHKATKAALISALIFPGCGHFYLKSKLRGAVFSVFSAGCLYVLVSFAMDIANDISEKLISGEIPLDARRLITEISSQLNGSAGETPSLASLLLLGCWGIAIIDSFILGRKLAEPIKNIAE